MKEYTCFSCGRKYYSASNLLNLKDRKCECGNDLLLGNIKILVSKMKEIYDYEFMNSHPNEKIYDEKYRILLEIKKLLE